MRSTGLRLNPTSLSTTSISCVTLMIYIVYLTTRALRLDEYRPSSKSKGDKMDHPKIYLGDQVGKMIVDGEEGWYMSAEKYVISAVENVEQNLENI